VLWFAPDSAYGRPEDLKALIDEAHLRGLMVFLDVVYNHFGPDGNWIGRFAPSSSRDDLQTPWGSAIDFAVSEVRDFFIENALYWLRELSLRRAAARRRARDLGAGLAERNGRRGADPAFPAAISI
jgi:1,4-alpha-glucan branching enzyme